MVAVDRAAEDRTVLLLPERDVVPEEDEVAELVEIQQHGVGVVPGDGPALDDGGDVGHLRHVPRDHVPAQRVVEPAREFVGVEEVGRADPLSEAVFAERLRPLDGQRGPLGQAVVIRHTLQDVVPVAAPLHLGEHLVEPPLQKRPRHGIADKVPDKIEELDGFVVEDAVQFIHRFMRRSFDTKTGPGRHPEKMEKGRSDLRRATFLHLIDPPNGRVSDPLPSGRIPGRNYPFCVPSARSAGLFARRARQGDRSGKRTTPAWLRASPGKPSSRRRATSRRWHPTCNRRRRPTG